MKLIDMEKVLNELCLSHKDIIYIDKNETAERIRKIPSIDIDRPQKVIAQITFDEEKLREIVKEAVERFKEEYEIVDRPQGEWVRDGHHIRCKRCNIFMCDTDREGDKLPTNYCPNCGARMKGADDES